MNVWLLTVLVGAGAVTAPQALQWNAAAPVDTEPKRPRPAETARLRAEGARTYLALCTDCHGGSGDGHGPVAASLQIAPRDFSSGVYKLRSTPSGSLPTDLDLFRTISRGAHGTAMFPWRQLTERQRWSLVSVIKAFSPRFKAEVGADPFLVPLPPPLTDGAVARGAMVYKRWGCGACHGESGAANGVGASVLQAPGSARAVNVRHLDTEAFIRGAEPADIFLTLRTGMDGTPMGAYPQIPDDDLWALAYFVRDGLRAASGGVQHPPESPVAPERSEP